MTVPTTRRFIPQVTFFALFWMVMMTAASLPVAAQVDDVELSTCWMATVDEPSQQILLRWTPSTTPSTMGYHICTGTPCIDYDTVFGRQDTEYVCSDHSALERHFYRLHVFDSAYNVSALTPSFGNMVVEASIPSCSSRVDAKWSAYCGVPVGCEAVYSLLAMVMPLDSTYRVLFTTTDSNSLHFAFELPEEATSVSLKVQATIGTEWVSQSNVVAVARRTTDTASALSIIGTTYDSVLPAVEVAMIVDTAFPYTLLRSRGNAPWTTLAVFHPDTPTYTYIDRDIQPDDTVLCYQLAVDDACGMNTRFSKVACVSLPPVPEPAVTAPNIVLAGDADNGTFLPCVQGMRRGCYELNVFNRQGLLVFHTDDPAEGWAPARTTPQGTYTYTLLFCTPAGDTHRATGTVTVVR